MPTDFIQINPYPTKTGTTTNTYQFGKWGDC